MKYTLILLTILSLIACGKPTAADQLNDLILDWNKSYQSHQSNPTDQSREDLRQIYNRYSKIYYEKESEIPIRQNSGIQ